MKNAGITLRITGRDGDWFRGLYRWDGADEGPAEVEGWFGKSDQTRDGTKRAFSFQVVRRAGNSKGPVGPATTHTGVILRGVMSGIVPRHRSGPFVGGAVFELRQQ